MSDVLIPKEKQSAFQRWEMHSFGDERPSVRAATAASSAAAPKVTIEELAAIREEARAKGHAEGLEEGRVAGFAQGQADAAAQAHLLRQIAAQLGAEAAQADELIARDVMNLALDFSRAMLRTALSVRPELVLPVVAEAIRYLPSLQQPALLMLHPADAQIVKNHLQDELDKAGWRLVEDPQIQRGGCRIDTASNQIDATLETRWQRLTEALGQNSEWLNP